MTKCTCGYLHGHADDCPAHNINLVMIDPLSKFLYPTDVPGSSPHAELLDALCEAHRQVDHLMAQILMLDDSYRPSKSPLWPETVKRAELIRKYGGTF